MANDRKHKSETVYINKFHLKMNTRNWMSQINNEMPLKQICFPGSHDAGMYHSKLFEVLKTFVFPLTKASAFIHTQGLDMKGQLEGGVRYFDIRPQYLSSPLALLNKLISKLGVNLNLDSLLAPVIKALDMAEGEPLFIAHHGIPVGDNIANMLKAANEFINNNKSEVVLLNFSHWEDFNNADAKFISVLLKYIDSANLLTIDYDKKIADMKLRELRGKVILIIENSEMYKNAVKAKGIKGIFNLGTEISIYDDYSNEKSYENMLIDQMEKFAKFGKEKNDEGKLFLLNWTLTPDGWNIIPFASGVHDYANDINPKLSAYGHARDFLFQPNYYGRTINIINGDYWENIGETLVNVCQEVMNNRNNRNARITLKSTQTNEALDMKPVADVHAEPYNGGLYQTWYKKQVKDNIFRLQNAGTGLYLRAATENIFSSAFSFLGLKDKDDNLIGSLEESDDDNLKWHFELISEKKYHIVSYRRKKDGDSHDRLDSSNGKMYLHTPNDGKFQIWEEQII